MIRFEQRPVTEGPLFNFNTLRSTVLQKVAERTHKEFEGQSLDMLLGEALHSERVRMRRTPANLFTRGRAKKDRALWNGIQAGLLTPTALVDRHQLLDRVLGHYADEIGGHFDPGIYRFATHAVPWGFNWLLNAASVQRFLPWGMTQALQSRLRILGEVPALQKLAQKGTILLVPTHQSNIDSILIGYVIYLMGLPPFAYGAGLNLFSNPVLNFFMSNVGAYTVDRQKSNQLYKQTLKNYSTTILREGIHSIFFPGGGRSRSGAIETKLKLGLMGTGLEAQLENHQAGHAKPKVFIVPMVTSYHFVLEATSLIEDYLAEAGKHRFIMTDDESFQQFKILNFFWRIFSSQSGITVRVGKPLDVFGNLVDEEGNSIGPNGTTIDPVQWLTTRGTLQAEPQRDREYTRVLGERLVERFHRDSTVLSSHAVAFAFFESLRKQYPDLDLYRFLRISLAQRSTPYESFLKEAEDLHRRLREAADRGQLNICEEMQTSDTRRWVEDGLKNLGLLHGSSVLKVESEAIWTEDMNLLYYYRNRLAGYGLSLLAGRGQTRPGKNDAKGFLV